MKALILVCLFVTFMVSTNATQAGMMETVPVGEEVYRWIYEYLDELYTRGLITDIHLGTKPYFRGQIARALLSVREKVYADEFILTLSEGHLLEELEREFSGELIELSLKASSKEGEGQNNSFLWGLDFQEGTSFKSKAKSTFRETYYPFAKAQIGTNFFACTRYMIDENLAKVGHIVIIGDSIDNDIHRSHPLSAGGDSS